MQVGSAMTPSKPTRAIATAIARTNIRTRVTCINDQHFEASKQGNICGYASNILARTV